MGIRCGGDEFDKFRRARPSVRQAARLTRQPAIPRRHDARGLWRDTQMNAPPGKMSPYSPIRDKCVRRDRARSLQSRLRPLASLMGMPYTQEQWLRRREGDLERHVCSIG
jgi:hypothetical protein